MNVVHEFEVNGAPYRIVEIRETGAKRLQSKKSSAWSTTWILTPDIVEYFSEFLAEHAERERGRPTPSTP